MSETIKLSSSFMINTDMFLCVLSFLFCLSESDSNLPHKNNKAVALNFIRNMSPTLCLGAEMFIHRIALFDYVCSFR